VIPLRVNRSGLQAHCIVCNESTELRRCDEGGSGNENEDMLLHSDGEAGSLQLQRRRKRRVSGAAVSGCIACGALCCVVLSHTEAAQSVMQCAVLLLLLLLCAARSDVLCHTLSP
jgi:hypothetical protein